MSRIGNMFCGIFVPLVLFLCVTASRAQVVGESSAREIKITADRLGINPKIINITKGEHVKLILASKNADQRFTLKHFDIEQDVEADESRSIDLTPEEEGRFPFSYSYPGIEDGSALSGELIVSAAPSNASSTIKVTFDPVVRGVVVVESGGERLRIDTAQGTVERIAEVTTVAIQKQTDKQPAQSASTKERESSRIYEPYDYHIVNVPTPKAVRRHSLNMYFTHRFQETITPFENEDADEHIARISKDLLGLDSSAVSSFGLTYGITDRLYANVYRSPLCQPGLCKTIELGLGYHFLDEAGRSPIALSAYSSVEGDFNFTERYTYNFQVMIGRSISKHVNVFFSPAAHINANGSDRFKEFLFALPQISTLRLGRHTGSFGFGVNGRITPTSSLLFEYTPRVGFKLGQLTPDFDPQIGQLVGFKNDSDAEIAFGIEKRIGRHVFSLTFSNTQTTTTARYNSSNQALPPSKFSIGFNLFRRLL